MALKALSCAVLIAAALSQPALSAGTEATAQSAPGYAQAKAASDAGQYAQALKILAPVVKQDPKNTDAWTLMGFASRNLKNYTEAARYYDIALRIDPRHLGALEYQGEMFVKLKQYDKARQNLKMLRAICGTCERPSITASAMAAV